MAAALDLRRWHPDAIPGRLVVLRRHRPEQFPAYLRWYRDPEVARLTRFQIGPVTDEEVRRFFLTRLVAPDAFAYAIHLADGDRLIGTTTLSALDADNGSVLFHITVGEHDCWGHGYGTEATALMVGHAFDTLLLHRVGLSVFAFNARAIKAYEKVGFRVEGRTREAVWRDGRFWDEVHMGILESEWRQGRARPASGSDRVAEGTSTGGDDGRDETDAVPTTRHSGRYGER